MSYSGESDRLNNFDESQCIQSESCCKVCSRRRLKMAGFGTMALLTVALIVGPTAVYVLANGTETTLSSTNNDTPLKVAAFNIQSFGRSKMSVTSVADIIVHILNRYDLILVQEVRDNTGSALIDLWSRLNKTDNWGMVDSVAIGRTSYKEQYVFFYRTAKARYLESFLVADPPDIYERDPFAAEFEYFSTSAQDMVRVVFLALHSRPEDAYEELVQLPKDITSVAKHFTRAAGVISMGDFNADCRYVSNTRQSELQIFNNASFTSLIPHSADTTAGSSDCAYDRVIVYGSDVQAREAGVFNFQTEYGLSDDVTADVSDHYPVEFKLF